MSPSSPSGNDPSNATDFVLTAIGSTFGSLPFPGFAAYSAAKAAVNQFTMCAAMEAAPFNVRVNVVAPGAVMTPGLDASTMKNKSMQDAMAGAIPMQRIGTPEEIARAICFLASDDASFITGVILPVDGGKTPQMHIPDFDLTALDNRNVS